MAAEWTCQGWQPLLPRNPAWETLTEALEERRARSKPHEILSKPTNLTGLNLHRAKAAACRSHQDLCRCRMKPQQTPTSSLTETANQEWHNLSPNSPLQSNLPKSSPMQVFSLRESFYLSKSMLTFSVWAEDTVTGVPHEPFSTKILEVHL